MSLLLPVLFAQDADNPVKRITFGEFVEIPLKPLAVDTLLYQSLSRGCIQMLLTLFDIRALQRISFRIEPAAVVTHIPPGENLHIILA